MKNLIITLAFILINASLYSQSTKKDEIELVENNLLPVNIFKSEASYNLEERMKFYKVPGLSITVIKDFKVVWTKCYGVTDWESQNPVTEETLFNVGSLSKGVASLTALALVEENKIDLNGDVNEQLNTWKIPHHKWEKTKKVTPLLLMNHSGGAMHHYGTSYSENLPNITQVLKGSPPAAERPTIIDHEPGSTFLYSNPGFAIIQQLIEDVEQKKFYEVANEKVFNVLNMNHSTFNQPLSIQQLTIAAAAHNGYLNFTSKRYYIPNAAAGGLWTTGTDFAKYVIELQKSYLNNSNLIISQNLCQEMLSSHVSKQYGLGMFLRQFGEEKYFGHMGDNRGFFAGFLSHLTDGYAVIVFTNSNTSAELIREINKSVAKVYHWAEVIPEPKNLISLSIYDQMKYCGRYQTGSDELITIEFNNGELFLRNPLNEKLFCVSDHQFMIKRREGSINFTLNQDSVVGLKYKFADNIGRISNIWIEGKRMDEGQLIPIEYIELGDFENARSLYLNIHSKNPSDPAIAENRLNRMGYQMISDNNLEAALFIFQLNIELYPNSANCYDSYADALQRNGQLKKSIENYTHALKLDPNLNNAAENLKKLTQIKVSE